MAAPVRIALAPRQTRAPWRALLPLALLLTLAGLSAPRAAAAGCVVTVNTDGPNPGPAGSLRAMLNNASCSAITFDLTLPATITLASSLPPIGRALTITGPGSGSLTIQGNNTFALVESGAPPALPVALSGLTLTKGKAVAGPGGNLRITGGTVTLTDVALTAATAAAGQGGAGAYIGGGAVTMTHVTISGNSAEFGGGLYTYNAVNGGSASATLNSSTVSGNSAAGSGGGLLVADTSSSGVAALVLTATTISDNTATTGDGGGLFVYNAVNGGTASATLTNATISGNSAAKSGGGLFVNHVPTVGGGALATLQFVTVTGNTADADNTGDGLGGGLDRYASTGSVINALSSIVAGNTRGSSAFDDCFGGITSQGRNLWGNNTTCPAAGPGDQDLTTLNRTIAQVLAPALAANGGPTRTHALVAGSPALDQGDNSRCPGSDQRGVARAQGATCDVGAYEARTFALTTGVAGGGTGTVSPGGSYLEGSAVAVSATATGGSTFTGWTVDGAPAGATNPLGLAMGAAHTVIAGFAAPIPSPSPSPIPTVNLTLSAAGSGSGSVAPAPGVTPYPVGSVVTLAATPGLGSTIAGWTLDGTLVSWAPTVTLTMNASHTLVATFAPLPAFGDVQPGAPYYQPVRELAARGIINGCDKDALPFPLFCPDTATLRHQMAALIVRAMPGWAAEAGLPTFTDTTDDAELMTRVATLQRHDVVRGYQDDVCIEQGKTPPCYGPLDTVKYGQVMLFIARAMVEKGYWTLQADVRTVFPDQNGAVGADPAADQQTLDHRAVVTYVHFAGAPPDVSAAPNAPFLVAGVGQGRWADASSRGWFARALWQALDSYFGADNVP